MARSRPSDGRRTRGHPLTVRHVRPTFSHLRRLIDERGIWQHAVGQRPDPAHGYCLDDATRAAIVMSQLVVDDPSWGSPLATCCHFINAALTDEGGARNFMAADGSWLDEPHHGDHVGRAIWALGVLSANAGEPLSSWSTSLLDRTVSEQSEQAEANLHTQVYALLGMAASRHLDTVRTTSNRYLDEICARAPGTPDGHGRNPPSDTTLDGSPRA